MRRAFITIAAVIMTTGLALAQSAPPAPAAPASPAAPQVVPTPETPAVKPPKPPRPPRAMRVETRGSYLGVDTRDVTPETVGQLKLPNDKGVEILMVDADAPAGKAGLKEHDVIVTYNSKSVDDVNELRRLIRDTAPGTKINLGISRDGKKMNVTAELADRSKQWSRAEHYIPLPPINIPPMPEIDVPSFSMLQYSRRSGLVVENITRQLGDYFGAKDGKGVLVRSVERNSPAETAGFKAGDVIIRVGSEPVENMSDWNQLMRSQQAGKVPVTVIREKHESTFTLSMPERRGDRSTNSWSGFDDLDDVNIEIANIGPEIQRQMDEFRKEWNSPEFRKQMVEAQKEAQKAVKLHQKEMQKAMQQAQKDVEKAMHDLEKQKITIHIDDDEE